MNEITFGLLIQLVVASLLVVLTCVAHHLLCKHLKRSRKERERLRLEEYWREMAELEDHEMDGPLDENGRPVMSGPLWKGVLR
jgi:hypothetical protein